MIRTFVNLFIAFALVLVATSSLEKDEIIKNYSAKKESIKNNRYHLEIRIRDGLKISSNQRIKTFVNSDINKNPYSLYDKFSISHHIMIMRKGSHCPSVFV